MTHECIPPEELRGVDGWHWVQVHNWAPRLAEWQVAPHGGRQPLWKDYERQRSCTPDWASREWGYRYLTPVLTPTEAAALRAERDAAVQRAEKADAVSAGVGAAGKMAIAMLHAENTRLREALEIYKHEQCEGFCTDTPGWFGDCAGCIARTALNPKDKS